VPLASDAALSQRYSPALLGAIDAGLAVRPEARPQSMAALRALLGLGAAAWGWRRGQLGQSLAPVLGFTTFLIALQIVALVLPGSGDPAGFGRTALIAYLVTTVLAWLADRRSTAATS
ncbi:MAG TPA: hypothetical protein PK913_14010, partial [Phenylobacterium sp.]|nr:hypothetical protein [Phenylobacterium sp.]